MPPHILPEMGDSAEQDANKQNKAVKGIRKPSLLLKYKNFGGVWNNKLRAQNGTIVSCDIAGSLSVSVTRVAQQRRQLKYGGSLLKIS